MGVVNGSLSQLWMNEETGRVNKKTIRNSKQRIAKHT
jgi:hypothetical protein